MSSVPENSIVYYKGEVTSIVRDKNGAKGPNQPPDGANPSEHDWAI
jgi:hypothetical protein